MNIDEIKEVVDRIVAKKEHAKRFESLKTFVDDRTDPTGEVEITVEKETFAVDPKDLKKLLDKKITDQDTTSDEAELKLKAK